MTSPLHCQWVITGLDYCITTSEGHGEWITGSVGHTGRGNIQSHRLGKYPVTQVGEISRQYHHWSRIRHFTYELSSYRPSLSISEIEFKQRQTKQTRDVTELRWISIFSNHIIIYYSIIIYHIMLYTSLYNSKQAPLVSN